MKITSDENVNQAVEQMVQAIRNTDAYMEYRRQLARIKEQPELKKQIDDFRTRNFELQTSKDTNFDKIDQFTRENEAFRENPLVSDFLAAELAFCRMMQGDRTLCHRSDEVRVRKGIRYEDSKFGGCRIGRDLKSGICGGCSISGLHGSIHLL